MGFLRLDNCPQLSSSLFSAIIFFSQIVLCLSSSPIVVPASQYWEGNDGPWSTFALRVGTPAQDVRVLLSSSSTTVTWVVLPSGCDSTDPSNCADLRGETFNPNTSSTWDYAGLYHLWSESDLGYTGNGEFGHDTVGLGWQGSGGPTIDSSLVAGFVDKSFTTGYFGLSPWPANLTDFNEPQPSFLSLLKNQSLIPSLSWGYSVSAHYRLNGQVYGSLVLGGYDNSRFRERTEFSFGQDIERALWVGLESIDSDAGSLLSTSSGIYMLIDTTVPHIWLPKLVCNAFERAFGLVWDEATNYYLVNESLHSNLLAQNPSFIFTLAETIGSENSPRVEITLPYSAFDLELGWPYVDSATRYFPLRRAANDSQYVLGRAFLQEAYLIVDYEKSTFSLSQCIFDENAAQNIVAIEPQSASSHHTVSTAAIAGGVVGGMVGILAIALLAFCLLRRCRRRRRRTRHRTLLQQARINPPQNDISNIPELFDAKRNHGELPGSVPVPASTTTNTTPMSELPDGDASSTLISSSLVLNPSNGSRSDHTSSSGGGGMSRNQAGRVSTIYELPANEPSAHELAQDR